MQVKNIVNDLTEGMQRLCAVANRVVAANGKVDAIERDLLLEDLRHLYEVALQIDAPASAVAPAPAADPEPEVETDRDILSSTVMATMAAMSLPELEPEPTPTPEPVADPDPEPEPEPTPEPEPLPTMEEVEDNGNSLLFDEVILEPAPEPEPIFEPEPEPMPEPETIPDPEPEPMPEPESAPEPEPEPAKEQTSLLDYLRHPSQQAAVNDRVAGTLGERLGGTLAGASMAAAQKVDDLRTVININDKFSFMSELFKNNMRAYNDFIMHLNSVTDREEALAHVAEVSTQYQWDENSTAVQSFWKVFDKKF